MRRVVGDELHLGVPVVIRDLRMIVDGGDWRRQLQLVGAHLPGFGPAPKVRDAAFDDRLAAELTRHDLGRQEEAIAGGVIGVVMRVDQAAARLAGGLVRRRKKSPRVRRRCEGVDRHPIIGPDDAGAVADGGAGDARTAALRVRVDVRRELLELGVPAGDRHRRGSTCRWGCGALLASGAGDARVLGGAQHRDDPEPRTCHPPDRLPATE